MVTGAVMPQLLSVFAAAANVTKLVAEAGAFLLMVYVPAKELQEIIFLLRQSFTAFASATPFG